MKRGDAKRWMARGGGVLAGALVLGGCGPANEPAPEEQPAARCETRQVTCGEQSIDKLRLRTLASAGELREEGTTAGEFLTYVDGRAGGSDSPQSYTYARFTPRGLERLPLEDQAALNSGDWDIAFRRYVIRTNGGVSGPSCTTVARTPERTTFESVKAVDGAWEFRAEDYYSETCAFRGDEWGLGSPATRLGSFWGYESCLTMTGDVYVVRLADGRHVKLQVADYYEPEPQRVCNETGEVPQPSGAAQFRVRWAFLP
jgi:hypothetical protein